jgi:hypothetical protein
MVKMIIYVISIFALFVLVFGIKLALEALPPSFGLSIKAKELSVDFSYQPVEIYTETSNKNKKLKK